MATAFSVPRDVATPGVCNLSCSREVTSYANIGLVSRCWIDSIYSQSKLSLTFSSNDFYFLELEYLMNVNIDILFTILPLVTSCCVLNFINIITCG